MQDGADEVGFGEEIRGRCGKRVFEELVEAEEECLKIDDCGYWIQDSPDSVCCMYMTGRC